MGDARFHFGTGQGTLRYGGNTTCVELRADGEIIVLDAGSGIRPLGLALEKEFKSQPIKLSLLITHAHWDHIQGLPFFAPAYEKKNEIRVRGYDGVDMGFGEIMAEPMKAPFFPIAMRELSATIDIKEINRDGVLGGQSASARQVRKSSGRLRWLSPVHQCRLNRLSAGSRAIPIFTRCEG